MTPPIYFLLTHVLLRFATVSYMTYKNSGRYTIVAHRSPCIGKRGNRREISKIRCQNSSPPTTFSCVFFSSRIFTRVIQQLVEKFDRDPAALRIHTRVSTGSRFHPFSDDFCARDANFLSYEQNPDNFDRFQFCRSTRGKRETLARNLTVSRFARASSRRIRFASI